MTLSEFSNEFDILYNNITSNLAPGLDEYEKSVFLTKALDDILKAYFNPRKNITFEGFDDSSLRLIDFSNLIKVKEYNVKVLQSSDFGDAVYDKKRTSKSITLPSNMFSVINEEVVVTRGSKPGRILQVVPIGYIEYTKLMSKPFKYPLHNQAWRLNYNSSSNVADIIVGPSDSITNYTIRYIKRPTPIITDYLLGVTIGNLDVPTNCIIDELLHPVILNRAVELAKAAYIGNIDASSNLGAIIQLSNNSSTDLGSVALSKK